MSIQKRVWKDRRVTYRVRVYHLRSVVADATFDKKIQAQKFEAEVKSKIAKGTWRDNSEAERTSLADAIERYISEVTILKRGKDAEASRLGAMKKRPLAQKFMAEIRSLDIARYRDQRLKVVMPDTVLREMNLIGHIFETARKEWGIHVDNPVRDVRKPSKSKARDRRLAKGEETILLQSCNVSRNPWLSPIVIIAIETGMRRSETLSVMWKDVDFNRCYIHLRNTKNGEERGGPLSSRAIATLKKLPRSLDGRAFPTTPNAVKLAFERACKRACPHIKEFRHGRKKACSCKGIQGLRFHDLRHEATSRLFEKGLNPMQVASITGHKTLQMLKRYTHLQAEDLAKLLG